MDETGAHLGQVEDHDRSAALLAAQTKAKELFDAVEDRRLILPGTTDKAASTAIHDLAGAMFGVSRHWHKRIVRSGPHTLLPYKEDPPDRVIEDDDIVFTDFGPVFEAWEADLGRTYVMGDDPRKLQLRDDVGRAFALGKRRFEDDLAITGAELFAFMNQVAAEMGWECGSPHCGHIIGEFPTSASRATSAPCTSPRGATLQCAGVARAGCRCTGSSRCTSWIARVASAASSKSC